VRGGNGQEASRSSSLPDNDDIEAKTQRSMEAWENDEWACSKNKSQGAVSCIEKQRVAIMTDHARAIEAGARACYDHEPIERMDLTEILWDDLTDGARDRFMHKAKACIEAAIATGDLVPASADQPAEKSINKIVGGAKEALAVARGEQPAARIYMQGHVYVPASAVAEMKERLADAVWFAIDPSMEGIARDCAERAVAVIRQLDLAPACGDYVAVPRELAMSLARIADFENDPNGPHHTLSAMLNAASSNGCGK
jgi:hypothetical protein